MLGTGSHPLPIALVLGISTLSTGLASVGSRASRTASAPAVAAPVPCPSEMQLIDDRFCIDRFEAGTMEIRGASLVPHSPFLPVTGLRVKAVSKKNVIPQGYISRVEAEAACGEAEKRLCSKEEWQTACEGPEHTLFPYGNQRKAGACVDTRRVSPLDVIFRALGPARYQLAPMNDPRLNQLAGTLAPTGSFAECTNAYGVYDMVGNLHEWTAEERGTFRGGYYLDTHINGDGCNYRTIAHPPTYHDYSTGFRCCADRAP